jgi:hypothetical protein
MANLRTGRSVNVVAASPTPAAVVQATEWRFLVRALYLGSGSPSIPGFTEAQVDQMLWGELPADAQFFAAMLKVLSASRPPHELGSDRERHEVALDATAESFRQLLARMDTIQQNPFDPGSRAHRSLEHSGWPPLVSGRIVPQMVVLPPEAARGFTPPNPEAFGNAAEFMEGMEDLRVWAKLSLRDLEDRSRSVADDGRPLAWLSRSTLSDTLKRHDKLPRREVVDSYVLACGLPPSACSRWLIAYDRLARSTSTRPVPS